jgi:molybdopterin/thiamine biosynthesis adenylyltransferase
MEAGVMKVLQPYLVMQQPPDGESYYSVCEAGLRELALLWERPLREVMIVCLEEGIWPERLRANRGAFSDAEQARLLGSHAAVIGLGGLGGTVTLTLGRLGVGELVLVDGDNFEESNLNRQLLATTKTLGRGKAEVAARALSQVSPVVSARVHQAWADEDNLPRLLEDCAVAVDCLDSLTGRYVLQEAACQAGIPLVHASVAGLEGMLMVIRPGDPGLKALYGPDPVSKNVFAEVFLGVPAMTPAVIGNFQANEAVKLLLDRPALASGVALHLDLEILVLERLELQQRGARLAGAALTQAGWCRTDRPRSAHPFKGRDSLWGVDDA